MNHANSAGILHYGFGIGSIMCLALLTSGCVTGTKMKLDDRFGVDGVPMLGTYVVSTPESVRLVNDVGMNIIIGDKEHLDPGTPMGKLLQDNGIKVLYHLTHHIHGTPRLLGAITAEQTTIPLSPEKKGTLPADGGLVKIEDELVRYAAFTPEALTGCERGADGTQPAAHHEGIILFAPEECAKDIEAVTDSPNLWGYYVLDDSPGDAISALRGLYETVERVEGPNHRPVCAGYGSEGSLTNFGAGVCDLMLIYWYPIGRNGYRRTCISQNVQWMLTTARARVPGVAFAGVYQAYWEQDVMPAPTPGQVREQMEDFVREGACGLIAFACTLSKDCPGWSSSKALQEAMKEVHDEINASGSLRVPPEPPELAEGRFQPTGVWLTPNKVPGLVPAWYIIGPFDDPDGVHLNAHLAVEDNWDLDAVHDGTFGPVRWLKRNSQSGVVGLGELQGGHLRDAVAYAACTVTSPVRQDVLLQIGRDDDLLVWLGDKEVYRYEGMSGLNRDEANVRVKLPAGDTPIRVKSCNREGMWGFCLRFTDLSGHPLEGLSFTPSE